MSWPSHHDSRRRSRAGIGPNLFAALVVIGIVLLIIGYALWRAVFYRCARSHEEQQTNCTVHRDNEGRRTGETCRTYPVAVCDEWVPR